MDTRKGRYTTINDGSTSEEEVTYEHDDDDQHLLQQSCQESGPDCRLDVNPVNLSGGLRVSMAVNKRSN